MGIRTVFWGTVGSIAGKRSGTTSASRTPAADNLRSSTSRVGKSRHGCRWGSGG